LGFVFIASKKHFLISGRIACSNGALTAPHAMFGSSGGGGGALAEGVAEAVPGPPGRVDEPVAAALSEGVADPLAAEMPECGEGVMADCDSVRDVGGVGIPPPPPQ
jgi:hypothetical protein